MKKLLLLTFLPVFGLLLSNNCFALQHDYKALYTGNIYHPDILYDSQSGSYYYDNTQSDPYYIVNSWSSPQSSSLIWSFPSTYDFQNTSPYNSVGYHLIDSNDLNKLTYSNGSCNVTLSNSGKYYLIRNLRLNSSTKTVTYNTRAFADTSWFGVNPCYKFDNNLSYHYEYIIDHNEWDYDDWNSDYTLPYAPENYSGLTSNGVDGLRLTDSAINHNGVTYDGAFSPSRLVQNNNMLGFKSLYIPLFTSDGYFMDYHNLYRGRQLEWHFYFNFNGPVVYRNDSAVKLYTGSSWLRYRPDQYTVQAQQSVTCTSHYINSELDGEARTTLDVVCPLTLNTDYINLFPYLAFESGGDYSFFEEYTNSDWFFSSAFLVSDNDYTPGSDFNDNLHGGDWSIFNGTLYDNGADPDWFASLKNLFVFGLPVSSTPLGLIFGGFSNQSTCASIPTIAGMLNSNETQVCPFFPSTVRAVVTPVLGLFSVCLVFGAFMSWLGGSSGNFIEDSSSHTWGGFKIAKGGKK